MRTICLAHSKINFYLSLVNTPFYFWYFVKVNIQQGLTGQKSKTQNFSKNIMTVVV